MIVELCAFLFLLTGAQAPEAEPLATVRHFSLEPGQPWAVRITASPESLSAHLWWIEGSPVHRGFPEELLNEAGLEETELPDLIEARTADLTATGCRSLVDLADELDRLATTGVPIQALKKEGRGNGFTLQIAGKDRIDLNELHPDHPLLRWANRTWEELSACASAASLR